MLRFDDFLAFAHNAHIVKADYDSRMSRLKTMLVLMTQEQDPTTTMLLRKWISSANNRLQLLKPLYDAAQAASTLPVAEIEIIHMKIKALQDG